MKWLDCDRCKKVFEVTQRNWIERRKSKHDHGFGIYCSFECRLEARGHKKKEECVCEECKTVFYKLVSQKNKNNFCSRSCSATFNNKNKTHGTRRSKLEVWLETELPKLYPNLDFHFNRKDTINSELDIYIPILKLAFELNGVFHYEPIYGPEKLSQIQNNDHRKFAACYEAGISLCIIDSSKQKRFTIKSSEGYLNIITKFVNSHLELTKIDREKVL